MRPLTTALFGLSVSASMAWCADTVPRPPSSWSVTYASDLRYYSWKGDRGSPPVLNTAAGRGDELYMPVALALTGKPRDDLKVQILLRSGWVRAQQTTAGLSGMVETFTDTVMSGTVTYLGLTGFQPFVGLSVNAPTGRSALFGSSAAARMDPDLVEIATFGEGWNVGPTVGVNLPITSELMITASVGYTRRGTFERERSTAEPNPAIQSSTGVNPGDVLTGTASIGYQASPWAWSLAATISEETTTQENGLDLYRAGRRYTGTGTVSYSWPDRWGQTTLTASTAHSNRNDVKFVTLPTLVTELMNTNSNLYRVNLQHLFAVSQNFAAGPTASFLHRDRNGYDQATLQFVPAKDRTAVGALARYAVSDKITLNFRGEHVWTNEHQRLAPNGQQFSVLANGFVGALSVPVISSTGWVFVGGANASF